MSKVTVAPSFWKSIKKLNSPLHYYYKVTSWFRYHFRKESLKLLKEWWTGYPWDSCFILKLERAKLREMIAYHEKTQRFVGWEYIVRDMKICVSLIDIMLEEHQLFHFDGKLLFVPTDEGGKDNCEIKESDDFKYVCDVNVNLRNADRFITDPNTKKFYIKQPHELYIKKASYLYHKIRYEHEKEWWD